MKSKWTSFGEFIRSVRDAAMPGVQMDHRLLQRRGVGGALGASEAVPGDGGFLVPDEFSRQILTKAYNTGQFLRRATYIPISKPNARSVTVPAIDEQSRTRGNRWGGVNHQWLNEGDTLTATKPKFRVVGLPLNKVAGLCYSTDELEADSVVFGEIMKNAFASELDDVEESFFIGTGAGQPFGLLNGPGLIAAPKETGQASATVLAQNIAKMWAQCWGPSRSRACWFVNQNIEPQLLTLALPVGTGGSEIPLYTVSQSDDEPFNRLRGRPVIPVEYLPTLGTVGDIVLADPTEYAYSDKGGIDGAVSMHIAFLTGQQAFRFIWRIAGGPTWHTPLTPAVGSLQLSPYVALAAR